MIVAALVVPSAPMLLPEYVGIADPLTEVRARAVAALRARLDDVERVVVVAAGEREPRHTKGSLAGRVARVLLAEAGWDGPVTAVGLPLDASADEIVAAATAIAGGADRSLLLVPADGSAKRTEKAPGHYDPRSAGVDAAIVTALQAGDPAALAGLDAALCEELWVTGWAALQVLARCFDGQSVAGEVIWSGDPVGVLYVIAAWRPARAGPRAPAGAAAR
ncbi:MAG: hypothetical protein V9G19_00365 [Tetrasphaera sp.]